MSDYPADWDEKQTHPAILCWHGHGKFGKDTMMGDCSSAEKWAEIALHNYDYGHQKAKAGGRNPTNPTHRNAKAKARDWCNLLYFHATMFGMTSLAINLAHARRD